MATSTSLVGCGLFGLWLIYFFCCFFLHFANLEAKMFACGNLQDFEGVAEDIAKAVMRQAHAVARLLQVQAIGVSNCFAHFFCALSLPFERHCANPHMLL